MFRKIIQINQEKCNGCGACAKACHEHAIGMEQGKAKLLREDHCDGLGDCLPACPMDAIRFVLREAPAFDAAAVKKTQQKQWPVQLRLIHPQAGFLQNADLLLAADCTAFAYVNFHQEFAKDRVVLVGCPKLDPVDYSEKLTEIFNRNPIQSVTLLRMEVPCCGKLERALLASVRNQPVRVVTISTDGRILKEETK